MADPFSWAAIGMAASAAGAGVSAFGSASSGSSRAKMYQYQAGIAQMNEKIAKQNADYSRSVGEVTAQESGLKTRAQIGETRAIQGASNLDVNTGSPSLVRASEHEIGQQDQTIIRSDAARRAYGFDVEAAQARAQGNIYNLSASSSRTAGNIGAISSILGGVSSVSSRWLQGRSVGLWGTGSRSGAGFSDDASLAYGD